MVRELRLRQGARTTEVSENDPATTGESQTPESPNDGRKGKF